MKKINILILIVLFLLAILIIANYVAQKNRLADFMEKDSNSVHIGNRFLSVEVVSTKAEMQTGLGGKEELCDKCGMLFEFPEAGIHKFWMKDMRFPLDIIWISRGEIVHIEKNIPSNFNGILTPAEAADRVLEVNAGMIDAERIKLGDSVSL